MKRLLEDEDEDDDEDEDESSGLVGYLVAPGIICGGGQQESQIEEGVVLSIEKSVGHEGVNRGHGTPKLCRSGADHRAGRQGFILEEVTWLRLNLVSLGELQLQVKLS